MREHADRRGIARPEQERRLFEVDARVVRRLQKWRDARALGHVGRHVAEDAVSLERRREEIADRRADVELARPAEQVVAEILRLDLREVDVVEPRAGAHLVERRLVHHDVHLLRAVSLRRHDDLRDAKQVRLVQIALALEETRLAIEIAGLEGQRPPHDEGIHEMRAGHRDVADRRHVIWNQHERDVRELRRIVDDHAGVDHRVAVSPVPRRALEFRLHRIEPDQVERVLHVQQRQAAACSRVDQTRIGDDVEPVDDRRRAFVDRERDVYLPRPGVDDGRVDRGVAITVEPVVEPDARDVALELGLVEVLPVLHDRRVADRAERREQEARARRRLRGDVLLQVLEVDVLDPRERQPPNFGRKLLSSRCAARSARSRLGRGCLCANGVWEQRERRDQRRPRQLPRQRWAAHDARF